MFYFCGLRPIVLLAPKINILMHKNDKNLSFAKSELLMDLSKFFYAEINNRAFIENELKMIIDKKKCTY